LGYIYVSNDAFGLTNVGDTFQRDMDLAFVGKKNKFVVIYLDDLTVFSNYDKKHLNLLRKVFDKCRKFEISPNLKKSLFALKEEKFLGHVISNERSIH